MLLLYIYILYYLSLRRNFLLYIYIYIIYNCSLSTSTVWYLYSPTEVYNIFVYNIYLCTISICVQFIYLCTISLANEKPLTAAYVLKTQQLTLLLFEHHTVQLYCFTMILGKERCFSNAYQPGIWCPQCFSGK